MILKAAVTALALCTAGEAVSVKGLVGRHDEVAGASDAMIFYNNCTYNVEMWKPSSARSVNIAPGTEFRQQLGPRGGPASTYRFAPRGSPEDAGRMHVTYVFDSDQASSYGGAKIHSSLGDPFKNVTLSLGLTSSCGSGPGAASASASGLYTAVATACGTEGAAAFTLGAGFCVTNGNQFDRPDNRAAAAAAAAANKGGAAAAAAGASSRRPGDDSFVTDDAGLKLDVDLLRLV